MPQTDWSLILKGNITLLWCEWSMKPENRDRSMGQVLDDFRKEYSNVPPLNIGSLLMASYILFVYPQQTEFETTNFSHINTDKFIVHEGTQKTDKERFCRRIRNSLAHGRFTVNDRQIELSDERNDGGDPFRSTISDSDFGDFISGFMQEVKNQHF